MTLEGNENIVQDVKLHNIRECIYETLKGEQMPKEKLLDIVYGKTNAKKCEISKIVTQMKREKIIYTVKDFEWLGIN